MNILQICDNAEEKTTIAYIVDESERYKVITKYGFNNISYVSYDAFIITIDILEKSKDIKRTLAPVFKQDKPIIFVYHSNNTPDDVGMQYISKEYDIKFKQMDCSVLETNNWNYKPDADNDYAYSLYSKKGVNVCGIKNTTNYYITKHKNVVIMHDTETKWYNKISYVAPDISRTANMLNFLFNKNQQYESINEIEWIDRISILDDDRLNEKLNIK